MSEEEEEYFVRRVDIDSLDTSLDLCQKVEGDVGCVVWDAAIVLAKYLEELYKTDQNCLQNVNVIELGSGVGCVGLTAACLGANVLLTDLPEVMPLLQRNVEKNRTKWGKRRGTVKTACLPWGQQDARCMTFSPDLILFADCIYYKESIDKLIDTLRNLSTEKTRVLMTQELRDSPTQKECWEYFCTNLEKYFKYKFVPLAEQNEEFRSPDIVLMQLASL